MIDIKLIEECRGGNFTNFGKLVGLTTPFAYSVAFRILGDEDLAKDIVQETMITMWGKIKRVKSAEGYKTWIYKIVINKCYDQLRKRKRNPEIKADELTWALISNKVSGTTSTDLENRETAEVINILTSRLSPKQKTVFVLSEIEEMSSNEISDITGMSKVSIKANLHYARKNISEMVEKYL